MRNWDGAPLALAFYDSGKLHLLFIDERIITVIPGESGINAVVRSVVQDRPQSIETECGCGHHFTSPKTLYMLQVSPIPFRVLYGVVMPLLRAAFLSDEEHRNLLAQAGFVEVATRHLPGNWIFAIGRYSGQADKRL